MNVNHALLASLDFGPISRAAHDWVGSTFASSVSDSEDSPAGMREPLKRIIHRVVVDPRTETCVATPRGYPDEFIGWAAAREGALVFVYVKYRHRRQGIGTVLTAQVVPDGTGQIRVAYWTRAAGRMALGGYPIVHDMAAQSELARLAR